jgi:hypothetical protein
VSGTSKGVLLAGGLALILVLALTSTQQGNGLIIPMGLIFILSLAFLLFTSLTNSEEKNRGSTPIKTNLQQGRKSIEASAEDLPDPESVGFDVPNL